MSTNKNIFLCRAPVSLLTNMNFRNLNLNLNLNLSERRCTSRNRICSGQVIDFDFESDNVAVVRFEYDLCTQSVPNPSTSLCIIVWIVVLCIHCTVYCVFHHLYMTLVFWQKEYFCEKNCVSWSSSYVYEKLLYCACSV